MKRDDRPGFCRFEKQNPQSMYIHFILVKNSHCGQGIAKILAEQAMKEFDGVTQCNFKALIHNDPINTLYSEHGCKKTGEVSLDPNTGKISDNPNAPNTHYCYTYTIK